jgi:ubiquinone/menaquinone biosynthesis C-methylase UbiE
MIFDVTDTAYDRFMGRYSVQLAPVFADFAGEAEHVLDVGAGTGALTAELLRRTEHVAAIEPSQKFADALHARLPGVDVRQGPGEELPWPDDTFDAALAQLVVAFMADAPAAAREMRRVVRPGGVVAVCMWDRARMEMFAAINGAREAIAPDVEERGAAKYRTLDELEQLLLDAGLEDVEGGALEVEAAYSGFDDFWDALVGGVGPAGEWVVRLDDERRAALPDELRRRLGEPDGPFTLRGTAWAARGRA